VLGAGASWPYGFPLGTGLRDAIRSLHKVRDDNDRLPLYDKCGASLTDLRDLGREFLYSGVKSIDAFLEKHPSLVDTGKLVIAREICESEKPKDLIGQADDNWYEYLWDYMHRDIAQADYVRTNHIRFLTFNYDRSLEFFLYNAIKNTFRVPADAALGASQGIKIMHIYGAVGDFHHADSATARAYSPDLNMAKLRLAADGIKIIPNARGDEAVFQEARDWFNWAEDICFSRVRIR